MPENGKARPRRQPEAGQHGAGQDRADHVPITNYSGFECERQGKVSTFLGMGKNAAVPARQLREMMGLKDIRSISKMVEMERKRTPICATTDSKSPGYFLPDCPDELSKYIKSLDRRLSAILDTRDALSNILDQWTGQQRLF